MAAQQMGVSQHQFRFVQHGHQLHGHRGISAVFVDAPRYYPNENEQDRMRYITDVCAALNIEVLEWVI